MRKPAIATLLLFAGCGALSFLAAPGHGLGILAFVSLIPMLAAVRRTSGYGMAALGGFLAGAVFFVPGIAWMIPVTVSGWLALALYCALYFAAFAAAARWSVRLTLLWRAMFLASFWVVLEFIRGVAFTGFPWLLLSHTQYGFTTFVQTLDVVGALGLSGVIVLINVLLFESACHGWRRKQAKPSLLALAVMATACTYGFVQLHRIRIRPSLRVAAVQAAVPQEMKEILEGNPEGKFSPEGVLSRYVEQTKNLPPGRFDLIVWPETVFISTYILNIDPKTLKEPFKTDARAAQTALADIARSHQAFVLTGASTYLPAELGFVSDPMKAGQIPEGAWKDRYNSAVLFDANGMYIDRYDKIHLVPFGEYIPMRSIFPFLARLVPFEVTTLAGKRQTIFSVPGKNVEARFGVLICYEDADAEMARQLRQSGADFIVNVSNDAWFSASELEQHFVIARFRAIENRVGVLRNGNNGITGLIDPLGRVQDGKIITFDAMGHIEGHVYITDTRSLYSQYGDTPVVLLAVLIVLVAGVRQRRVGL